MGEVDKHTALDCDEGDVVLLVVVGEVGNDVGLPHVDDLEVLLIDDV